MAKAPADTVKYNIYADIRIDGIVERPDVVGALFGQTEGLLGEDLELRDLQKTGRVGRIEVTLKMKNGKSTGTLLVPSSLDMVETSIIGAAIEAVDRVGPCNANITIKRLEDARNTKRTKMVDRAKTILKTLMEEEIPESMELTDEVRKSVQLSEITTYQGLPAGPAVESSDSIILVEGRADVLTLLKCGIKNAVGVGGTNIPPVIKGLSKEKTTIAFIDGDRGGEIILRELLQVADIDFVARAPKGKEVEDLQKKEVIMGLRRKIPASQVNGDSSSKRAQEKSSLKHDAHPAKTGNVNKTLLSELDVVKGKLVAKLFDDKLKEIAEVEIKDLIDSLSEVKPAYVVLDGIITQRLVDAALDNKIQILTGVNTAAKLKKKNVRVLTTP